MHRQPAPGQFLEYLLLEWRVEVATGRLRDGGTQRFGAALGVVQPGTQQGRSDGRRPAQIDVGRPQGTDHHHFPPRPCDGHVQATLAPGPVQRSEAHGHPPRLVGAVADRQKNYVALVALDVLQVLHEKRLVAVLVEELLEAGIGPTQPFQFVEDGAVAAAG